MISCGARAAAVALAIAVLAPGVARADPLSDAERGVGPLEDLLASVDEAARRPDETPADRAARKFSSAETHYLLGDWAHAALLFGEALDDASFREGPQGPIATFYLGDTLRRGGSCGAARPYLAAYVRSGDMAHRGEALAAALDCAVRLDRQDEVRPLLVEADRYYQGQLSPELRYLSAKALRARTDLPLDERSRQAEAAFAAVPAPFAQQAAYFQGVLRLERNDLAGAAERFAACAAMQPADARQREVQDLCTLGVARVGVETGDLAGAIGAYAQVPIDSQYFDESLYEAASTHGRAGQLQPALRASETLVEIAPDSPLASRAMLLQGELLLRQEKYEAASFAFERVTQGYAPVRDALDDVLTLHEDPVRYLADLLSQAGKPAQVATVIPVAAMRSALARPEMARASALMQELDAEARDLETNRALGERLSAALARGDGIDASPRLRQAYAGVQAVENGVALLQGEAATAAVEAAEGSLEPGPQAELARVHAERLVLGARLDAAPRDTDGVRARLNRWRVRMDALDREAFALGYMIEGARASIVGTEVWVERHRGELQAERSQREGLAAELRKHREVVASYEEELRALRQEIALARDAAGGSETLDEESRLRAEYLSLLAQERRILDGARGRLSRSELGRLERAWAASDRLDQIAARARALADRIAGEARTRAEGLRAQLASEKALQARQATELKAATAEARGAVGQVAYRSFRDVRGEFYGLVLRADVGLNDVAWRRKGDRVERIQKLSQQQADQLKALDRRYQPVLKEEE